MRSSAAAERSDEGMAYKIRLERNHFLMLWTFHRGFGDAYFITEKIDIIVFIMIGLACMEGACLDH